MGQPITETERKVIDILVQHEPTNGVYGAPIHAVDLAMGWATAKTVRFVDDLMDHGLIHWEAIVGRRYDPESVWKKGPIERTHWPALRHPRRKTTTGLQQVDDLSSRSLA
jgi:hypothetical protein